MQSFGKSLETETGNEIIEFEVMLFEEKDRMLKNKMEKALLNLTDDNVEELLVLSNESVPDHSCNYSSTSIFKNINPNVFTDKVLHLNNKSIESLCKFLSQHYHFYFMLNVTNQYGDDLPVLNFLYEKLEKEIEHRETIDKYMLKKLLRYLEGALRRAKGENNPIDIN